MAAKPLLVCLSTSAVGGYLELTHLSSQNSNLTAITPAILIGTGFWTLMHGFKVGKARTTYAELAKQDGEKDVDERYLLPNLYAQGTSQHVKAFNCIQRSHQQIFETFTTVVLSGMVGAITFPVCTSISTLTYAIGRYYLSKGYSECEGDSSKRYKYKVAKYMWYGMLSNVILGMASSAMIVCGGKLLCPRQTK